jgi:hypothetical protein
MNILVHPLVVMSIADHSTRDRVQWDKERAIGVMFGTQSGRTVNILEAFEIAYKDDTGSVVIDRSTLEADMKLSRRHFRSTSAWGGIPQVLRCRRVTTTSTRH